MKKKFEFSKIIILLAILVLFSVGIWSIIKYYSLTKLAITTAASILPDAAIPIACISTILGTILSYCLYQGLLKNSLNKNKLTIDECGKISPILDTVLEEVVEDGSPTQTPRDCDYDGE